MAPKVAVYRLVPRGTSHSNAYLRRVLVRRSRTSVSMGVELRSTLAALAKGERSSP